MLEPPAAVSLLVVYSDDIQRLRIFYEALGIELVSEQHGTGPRHFSGTVGQTVVEFYPAGERHLAGEMRFGRFGQDGAPRFSVGATGCYCRSRRE